MFGIGKKSLIPEGWNVVDLGLLGSGGMSFVHRVRDDSLGREVAFKVLRPELAKEDLALERFVEEARITAQLDHPNIPAVYALASDKKSSTCFTMKLLQGQSLQQLLEANEGANIEGLFTALDVLVRVCDAVAFAHARGILHLDLKPANVMVGEFGQIYLVDWGLARRKDKLPTAQDDDESVHGTPAYMAPEQARGQNHALDERTDVFALGGMLYRILAGRPPYVAATGQGTFELAMKANILRPEEVAALGQSLPRRLVAICLRALSEDPQRRYPSAVELKRELEAFIRGTARLPEQHFKAGEAIVIEGETGDSAYVILEGHCQASRVVAGKKQMLRLLGQGEMFGETAVLTGAPFSDRDRADRHHRRRGGPRFPSRRDGTQLVDRARHSHRRRQLSGSQRPDHRLDGRAAAGEGGRARLGRARARRAGGHRRQSLGSVASTAREDLSPNGFDRRGHHRRFRAASRSGNRARDRQAGPQTSAVTL